MYQPPHFREDDLGRQHALIRENPLGLLISAGADGLLANPIPFHLEPALGEKGALQAHLARANAQWRHLKEGAEVLVVFQGAEAYVTPSWYATKRKTGKVVPTWNFSIVQARGQARLIDDEDWLRRQISLLTADQERLRAKPWAPEDAPEGFIAAQIRGIVGVEILVTSLEGKWKVSQNRPETDRAGVAQGFADPAEPNAHAGMAELVRRYGEGKA